MTKTKKLPDYFEKYLDQKFDNVNIRFNEMSEEISILRNEIGNIKLSSVIIGGIGGILTAVGGYLGLSQFRK